MPNFFTLDDGVNYAAISLIDSFGYDHEEPNKGGTWIRLKDGKLIHISRPVTEVAEMLGSVNLHY